METDLLAYLEGDPGKAPPRVNANAKVDCVSHELVQVRSTPPFPSLFHALTYFARRHQAVASELIADGQDVQYLHIRNALRKRLGRVLTAAEKDILSTFILRSQKVCELRLSAAAAVHCQHYAMWLP